MSTCPARQIVRPLFRVSLESALSKNVLPRTDVRDGGERGAGLGEGGGRVKS